VRIRRDWELEGASLTGSEIVLVCASDRAFAMGASVMLYSALVHLRPGIAVRIYMFDCGLEQAERSRIARVVERTGVRATVEWLRSPALADASHPLYRMPHAAYARLDMGSVLPKSVHRAIYLDADLLVLADLSELCGVDMQGHVLSAVQDYYVVNVPYETDLAGEPGLSPDRDVTCPYFNSGLMLVDLERWRALDLGNKAAEYLADRRRLTALDCATADGAARYSSTLKYGDQDALNAVLRGRWMHLDCDWNVSALGLRYPEYVCDSVKDSLGTSFDTLRTTSKILHFCGPKPWDRMVLEPLAWRWWAYCRRSGWFAPAQGILAQGRWVARTGWNLSQSFVRRAWARRSHA